MWAMELARWSWHAYAGGKSLGARVCVRLVVPLGARASRTQSAGTRAGAGWQAGVENDARAGDAEADGRAAFEQGWCVKRHTCGRRWSSAVSASRQ